MFLNSEKAHIMQYFLWAKSLDVGSSLFPFWSWMVWNEKYLLFKRAEEVLSCVVLSLCVFLLCHTSYSVEYTGPLAAVRYSWYLHSASSPPHSAKAHHSNHSGRHCFKEKIHTHTRTQWEVNVFPFKIYAEFSAWRTDAAKLLLQLLSLLVSSWLLGQALA